MNGFQKAHSPRYNRQVTVAYYTLCPSQHSWDTEGTLPHNALLSAYNTGREHTDLILWDLRTRRDSNRWSWEGRGKTRELREAREEVPLLATLVVRFMKIIPNRNFLQTVGVKDMREHFMKTARWRWWVRSTGLHKLSHRPLSHLGKRLSGILQSGFHTSHANGLILVHLGWKFSPLRSNGGESRET